MLNLVQLQERLKDVPMASLMSYANGQNPQVPPFLALGELNRRKKMQEEAASAQAQEMEGAPTVKQQIEQATGLMALQGSRQRAAAQQQQGLQAAMPMPAPNTTTSEPAQLASGGAINDTVVPRDFQRGGIASMNPEMMKRLMMMKAMRQRKAGLGNLPANTFKRQDYVKGGIVAFAGPDGSMVEGEEDPRKKLNAAAMAKIADLIAKREGITSLQDRLRAAGYEQPLETGKEELAALMAKQQQQSDADTVARRILALDPFRIGKSAGEYMTAQEAKQAQVAQDIAKLRDLQAKSMRDQGVSRITEGRGEEIKTMDDVLKMLKEQTEMGYKQALGEQAVAGKVTNLDKVYRTELASLGAQGKDVNDPRVQQEAMRNAAAYVTYAGPRVDVQQQAIEAANARSANDAVNDQLKKAGSALSIAIMQSRKRDPSGKEAQQIVLDAINQQRARMSPPLPPLSSLPPGVVIPGAAPSAPAAPAAPAAPSGKDPLGIR